MFKKEIYSLLLFSFGLLFTCCGESATDDEEKDNNGQGSVSVETNYLPIADPYVMFYNNKYYAYGTGHGAPFQCKDGSWKYIFHAHWSAAEIQPRTSYIKDFAISDQGVVTISGTVIKPRVLK